MLLYWRVWALGAVLVGGLTGTAHLWAYVDEPVTGFWVAFLGGVATYAAATRVSET